MEHGRMFHSIFGLIISAALLRTGNGLLDCDFQSDFCGYTQLKDDNFDWVRYRGVTSSIDTGPSVDHTQEDVNGYYAYIETSSGSTNYKARLQSPVLNKDNKYCVEFYYHMYGSTIGALNVYQKTKSLGQAIWTQSGDKGDRWLLGQIAIKTSGNNYVVFEGVRGSSFTGDIAIDDVGVVVGSCPIRGVDDCDFENSNLCGYTQAADDDFDWTRKSGSTPSAGTGPSVDSSFHTSLGHYMYTEVTNRTAGETARLTSTSIDPTTWGQNLCWTFSYHMYGTDIGTLNVWIEGDKQPIWTRSGDFGNSWYTGQFSTSSSSAYTVSFEVVVAKGGDRGDIAIDEVKFVVGKCAAVEGACDFEIDKCAWTNYQYDDFDWTRHIGLTSTGSTGPGVDHTTGTAQGYYLYIESNSVLYFGDSAYLVSPPFDSSFNYGCLSFWYNMYGPDVGSLRVYTTRDLTNPTQVTDLLWGRFGQTSADQNHWQQGLVPLNTSDVYRIEFQGERGAGSYGDLAIDDITLDPQPCDTSPTGADPANFQTFECDFEASLCGWEQDEEDDDFDWLLDRLGTPSASTGPSDDHSLVGNGHYIYTESNSPQVTGDRASLISPIMAPAEPDGLICFYFWYHMFGQTMGTLRVHLTTGPTNQETKTLVWLDTADRGNEWLQGFYQVQTEYNWRITIEGETGGPTFSDMAVDDTSYELGKCPELGFCHFELDFCTWYQEEVHDDFNWGRSKGSLTGDVGAPMDKTTNTAEGYFAYIDTTNRVDGASAILYSYNLTTVGVNYCVQFWYLFSGAGALQVLWRYPDAEDLHLLWQEPASTGSRWMYNTVSFKTPDVIQVLFRGVVGSQPNARVAIDEVSIGIGTCASPVDCTFDDGYCGWQQDRTDNFDWTRDSGGTPSGGTGPPVDHTPGPQLGYYLYIESSSENEGERARLYSAPIKATVSACFEVWYHMYGTGVGALNIYVERVASGSQTVLFSESGDKGNVWLQARMDIQSSTDFFIVIEAVEGLDFTSDIAIDDTKMYDYLCGSPPVTNPPTLPPVYEVGFLDCSFEGNTLCLWSQVSGAGDDFDWTLTNGASDTIGTGPPADHTKQSQDGFYVHIDVSGQTTNSVARLISPVVGMDGVDYTDSCLEFWYHMYGPHVDRLNVLVTDDPNDFSSSAIWTKATNQGYDWLYEQIQISNMTSDFYYVFEGYAGESYQGDIALDDIVVLNGTCPGRRVCDFEVDQCGYVDSGIPDFPYRFYRGSANNNPSLNIPWDHTYSTEYGHFMYMEPFTHTNLSYLGAIVAPRYAIPPGTVFVKISYWSVENADYGLTFASISYDYATRSLNNQNLDMKREGSSVAASNEFWFHRVTYLAPTADITGFYLYIFGYFETPFGAEPMAVDDIEVSMTDIATYTYFCTFETDACSWVNAQSGDEFDWFRNSGGTPSFGTGPAVDHTLSTPSGWYMFIDGSHRSPGDRARLEGSMVYYQPLEYCLQFWFHMKGEDVGSLRVMWETSVRSYTLWSLEGDQGDQWQFAMVSYRPPDDFRLVFEATTGAGINSDIAIDDVYYQTTCVYPTPPPRFDCQLDSNSTVEEIAPSQVCDWIVDCSTGLDERMCMPNSFEDGLGRYEVIPYLLYPWVNTTGADGLGPSQDWSGNDTTGTYMMVDTANPFPAGLPLAILASPEIQQAYGSSCQISFWYYMSGDAGRLVVSFSPTDDLYQQTVVARLYGDQGKFWKQAIVNLNRIAKPFQLGFEALPSLGSGEIIAIDEITESDIDTCGPPARQPSCSPEQFRCSNGACVTQDKLCDFTDDCGDFSDELACSDVDDLRCGFELGLCRFSQVSNGQDNADWLLTSGQVIDNVDRSAPTRDHTRNEIGGQFLLFDQTQPGVDASTKAWLASPTVIPGANCTLKFWFYTWGDEAAGLNVHYRKKYNDALTKLGGYGQTKDYDFWQDVTIDLPWSGRGQVLFESTGATGPDGSVALDDISMLGTCSYSSDPLPGIPTTAAPVTGSTVQPECQPSWYICPTDQDICVTPSQKCNFYDNCPRGEDEESCGQCEYNNGDFCGAENVVGWVGVTAGFYPLYPTMDANQSPSAKGNYLATFVSYSSLTTPMLGPSGSLCQLEFDYYMTGDPGFLEVYLIVDDSPTILMRVEGDQGDEWYHPVLPINDIKRRFQIQIVNQRFESDTAQVAIDRLNYITCDTGSTLPSKEANCTFEIDTCGYYQLKDDDFDWTRYKGTTSSTTTGPTADHTTGTGYYMFIETSSPNLNYWVARMALHPQRPTDDDGLCLIFYYHMFGDTIDTLNVILVLGTQEEVIFSRSQSQGNRWRKGLVHISTPYGWQVIFEARRGVSFTGDIAIDDVFYFPGACPSTSTCTFETGLCSWSQDGLDDFDWSLGSNGAIDQGTGPSTDYTTGSIYGTFAYAYNQAPRTAGEVARLYSPLYQETAGTACLSFFYIVYGKEVGALSVSYYDVIADATYGPIWEKFGTVDQAWRKGYASIQATHAYQIVIGALLGSSSAGSIAVDEIVLTQGACPREGFCDFEEDLCNWANSFGDDDFDWIQNSGPTTTAGTGPSVDHTYGSALGSYLYIETSSGGTDYKARLNSPFYLASQGVFSCLTLWYHMYGSTVGSLKVYLRDEDNKLTQIWTMSGNKGDRWIQGQVNLYNEKQYQVVIEGVRGASSTGDIAVDDVDISDEVCESPPTGDSDMDCTFESDFCSFTQDTTEEHDWLIGVNPDGPNYDRTTGSGGDYIYMNMNVSATSGDSARLLGPLQVPTSVGNCLSFWYHMSGPSIDRFGVYLREGSTDSLVFARSGAQGDEWIRGQKNIQLDTAWQVIFEGRYNAKNVGHVALDDVVLDLSPCTADYECTFETGLCGWTQGTDDILDWTLFEGFTSSPSTGPDFDHTTGTAQGYYIYLETSIGTTGNSADLFSPTYSYTDADCFTMWYHMYGSTMGTLNVYVHDTLTLVQTRVFSKSGLNVNEWRYATMSITARHDFQMRLEAIRGPNYYSDMAVDDIKMTPGACSGRPGFCDFESGFCGWINDGSEDWDWDRTRGREGQVGNPGVDHTTGTNQGFYLSFLIAPPTVANGDNAILISEYMQPVKDACFKMWYHMTGTAVGTLKISVKTSSSMVTLATLSGDIGNVWRYLPQSVTQNTEFRIYIEATSASTAGSGHIAIDDVDLEPVSCASLTTAAPTNPPVTQGPTQPVGIYDCTFEADFCSWTQDTSDQAEWERTLGTTFTSDTGAIGDHTTGGLLGWFIHVDASGTYNKNARILSPQMTGGPDGMCVRFWYNMFGADINTLNMIQRNGVVDTVMWTKTGNQGQIWLLGQVHITGTFTAVFEVITGSGSDGDICLDDISFWYTECPAPDICDFEEGPAACDITQDGTDLYDWFWTNAASGNKNDGSRPDIDKSTGTDQGYYYLFNETTDSLLRGNEASFFSQMIPAGELCLQFWFRTGGFNAKLEVSIEVNGNTIPAGSFNKYEDSNGRWHLGQLKLLYGADFKLRFKGLLNVDDEYVAIDDIDFSRLTCSDLANTDFEDGYGTYVNVQGDDFDWVRQAGDTPSQNSGPSKDHTLGTEFGYYAFIDTSPPRTEGELAWLVSDTNVDVGRPFCMSVWYHMYGATPGTLTLYQRASEETYYRDWRLIKSWSGDKGDYWNHELVDISAASPLIQVVFEGMVGEGNQGDIAIDDIVIYPGECVAPTDPPCVFLCDGGQFCLNDHAQICNFVEDCSDGTDEAMCGACDFENGACGLHDLSTGSYRWINSTGATPTDNTGPTVDHTLGTEAGSYLYVDADSGSGFSEAVLRTPYLYDSSPSCLLTTWVHIQGDEIGKLALYITRGTLKTLLLYIPDPLGPDWVQIQVGVGRIMGQFQVQFEAVRSFSVLGDIAIDDISYSGCSFPPPEGVCRDEEFRCDSRGCIDYTRVCDLSDDCGDYSDEAACAGYVQCTFEYNLCNWQQLHTEELDWYRISGGTQTSWTGPERDHTTGLSTGHYLYLESSSPRKPGDRARLGSTNFRALNSDCQMRFYYHMFGEDIGSLNVYKRTVVNGPLQLLWSQSGDLGDFYERADIVLANNTDYDIFQVIIEATVGNGIYGDIAIDDISFTDACDLRNETQLPEVTTLPPVTGRTTQRSCQGNDFICSSGFCIPLDQRCDGTPHCADGSDEDQCGDCDFESSQCGWQIVPTGLYTWVRQVARNAPASIAPADDHTTGSPDGYYMYVDQTQGTYGLSAVFQSPYVLGNTGTRCQLEYWYHLYGGDAGALVVYIYENLIPVVTQSYVGTQGQQWNKGLLDMGARAAGQYYVKFEATPGGGLGDPNTVADIAVDDIKFVNCGSSADISCDFGPSNGKTLCGWEQDKSTDNFDWTLRNGGTPTYYTGPKGDHTTEGPGPEDYGTGAYIFSEMSGRNLGDKCRLLSGSLKPTSSDGYCFSFWYHMYGSTVGEFNVYTKSVNGEQLLFHKRGTQEFEWLQGYRTIQSANSFEIIIEAVRANGFEGDIGVDDLSYEPVPCPPPVDCEFESDFCEWTNVADDTPGFDWERGKNGDPTLGTGPPVDHSSESSTAYFAFANVAVMPEFSEARLASPLFDRSGVQCLTFFYNMYGADIGTLFVYKQDEGDSFVSPSWEKTGDQGQYWRQAQVQVSPTTGSLFRLYFEAIAGSSQQGSMAIDDVSLLPGVCEATDFCDFERGLCTWQNDHQNDNFDWIRDGAGTGSSGTGPDVDHTFNSKRGYYMYVEANGKTVGDKAWFVSDRIPPTAGRCFDFWYHMFGSAVETLNLYQQNMNQITPTLLWTTTGNYGNVWLNAKVPLSDTDEFWVYFEGLIGQNATSDIALDDLHIADTACSTTPAPPTTTTLPPTYPPDTHDCDFQQNLCLWAQDRSDQLDWTRAKGSTSSIDTGPGYDHTYGNENGYYIFLETSTGSPDYKARLLSSTLVVANGTQYCMEFWHHMYGLNINSLNIYIKQQGPETLLWTKTGDQGDNWLQAVITLPQTGTYQIIIEATRGTSYAGDIAVDDIKFYFGRCPPTALCDFEYDDCQYQQSPTNDFPWNRVQAGASGTALTEDHSTNTRQGHYMYADFTSQAPTAKAAIVSAEFPATTGSCLNFYFAPIGDLDAGTLTVIRRGVSGTEGVIWSSLIGRLHNWHLAQATVASAKPGEKYMLVFEASRDGGTVTGGVAIDDVETQPGICTTSAIDCDFESKTVCGWQQLHDPDDDFDWAVISGTTSSGSTGPSKDHTLNSAQGHYAYIESSSPQVSGDFARLLSPIFSGYQNRCLEFFYHMYGAESGDLTVYRRVEDFTEITLFSQSDNKGDTWRKGQVTLDDTVQVFDVVIEATVGSGFAGDIAIDDTRVFDGVCPDVSETCEFYCGTEDVCVSQSKVCNFVPECPNQSDEDSCGYSCQFESDFCGWTSETTGLFRWVRGRGQSPEANTGPFIDHTTLSSLGYYIYVSPHTGSLTWASLTSPKLHDTATSCEIHFWALLSGDGVGYIDVVILNDYSSWTGLKITAETGVNVWEQQIVRIGRNPGALQVSIRSSRSFAVTGAVAIDDILFSSCDLPVPGTSCQPSEFECDNSVCIADDRRCDYNDDCGDFSEEDDEDCPNYLRCSFEDGMCEYSNLDDDDLDWTRASGADTTPLPPIDHTLLRPGGSFLYVGNAPANANTARLGGPVFQGNSTGSCTMRLWFYNYGSSPGSLQIGYRTGTNGPVRTLAEVQGPIGNYWERYELALSSSIDFQPVIVAIQNYGVRSGIIAIDDITYTDACVQSSDVLPFDPPDGGTTVSPCGTGKWRCADAGCIDRSQVCDYADDCGDGSDEAKCGQCDFEVDYCGYTDKSLGNHAWARTVLLTRAAGDGNYVRVDTGTGVFDEPAVLQSALLPVTSPKCVLQFWYRYQATEIRSNFNVVIVSDDDITDRTIVWYPTATVTEWTQATVSFGRQTKDFYIQFEGSLYVDSELLHLDEIVLTDCKSESYEPCEIQCANAMCVPKGVECDYSDDCGDMTDEKTCDDYVERCNFEDGLCNWSQMTDDDMDWARITAKNGKQGGAPGWDHTTISPEGSYLYLYSLSGDKGKTARISSVVFMPSDCKMRFWYHMYGANVNRLQVLTRTSMVGDFRQLWVQQGRQGDGWILSEVAMEDADNFQVVIEATAGASSTDSDHIAIDDISFTPGCLLDPDNALPISVTPTPSANCEPGFSSCRSDLSCISDSLFCDFIFDCDDGSDEDACPTVCNFEDGLCQWSQDTGDDTDWHVYDSDTTLGINSPISDHTLNNPKGQYVYVDGTLSSYNQRARLVSPVYGQTGSTCSMSFWYYQYAAEYGDILVYLSLTAGGQDRLLAKVTRVSGDTDNWIRQDVFLPVCVSKFRIILDALNQQSVSQSGGVAVDDIRFDTCQSAAAVPSCGSGFSQCSSGQCYPNEGKCDFNRDCCSDSADETGCSSYKRCNFDLDMCTWSNTYSEEEEDDGDWTRRMAGMVGGPAYDHTTDSSSGYYAIMGTQNAVAGDRAHLKSFVIDPVTSDCYLRMYVYLGDVSSSVTVYTRTETGGPLTFLWSVTGSSQVTGTWGRYQVPLSSTEIFQVVVEATRGTGSEGAVALDDTSFTPSCNASSSSLPNGNPTDSPRTERPNTPVPHTGRNTAMIIAVSVICGVFGLLIILGVLVCLIQRRKENKETGALGGGVGNPSYGEQPMSDFKMSSADDFPFDDGLDGIPNEGFMDFGSDATA